MQGGGRGVGRDGDCRGTVIRGVVIVIVVGGGGCCWEEEEGEGIGRREAWGPSRHAFVRDVDLMTNMLMGGGSAEGKEGGGAMTKKTTTTGGLQYERVDSVVLLIDKLVHAGQRWGGGAPRPSSIADSQQLRRT